MIDNAAILPDHTEGDTVIFRANIRDDDGSPSTTTPSSAVCSVWDEAGTVIVNGSAGTTASGYAQYAWATGSATAQLYRAVLTVTISAGNVQTQEFLVKLRDKPPAFTTDLSEDVGVVRMELGDDVRGAGVLPNSSNLSDEQIQTLLDREGNVMRAVAAACEMLARRWTQYADRTLGPLSEQRSQIAKGYRERASELRGQFGYGADGASGAFSYAAVRVDGYSENADTDGEYSD